MVAATMWKNVLRGLTRVSRKLRILYVEDNLENQLLVQRVLEAEGFEVVGASDGATGLQMAQDLQPDLILVDIGLPGTDGYEVTRRLRQLEGQAQTPIVAVTAHVLRGDREQSLAAGCDGYIPKPIDVDRFPEQVRSFLALRAEERMHGHSSP
jgi:two-component system cell cycle response regulator DivK